MVLAAAMSMTLRVSANGVRLISQDAFAASRGEAVAATADNPSTIYYNPAGITQLEGDQVRLGINALHFDPTFQPTNGSRTFHLEDQNAVAPHLYYTHSFRSLPFSAGIGIYSPYGASVTWPQDTGFRTVATEAALTYLRVNPVVAFTPLPNVSLGGGIMVDYGKLSTAQGLRPNEHPVFYDVFEFDGDGWAVGYNLGLLWQVHKKVSVGASLRSETSLNFQGHTYIERQFTTPPTSIAAETEYTFPLTAVVGLSYRPTAKWNLEVNADYTDWSSVDVVTIRQAQPPPFPLDGMQDIAITNRWRSSWMIGAGATHYFPNGWHGSAGYLYNQNSVPDTYYSPVVADLDRHFFSLGLGRQGERFRFDVTYQLGYGPSRTVSGSVPPSIIPRLNGQNADGTYEWISHALLVSVGLRF